MFLSRIFRKKAGGSFVGNLIAGFAKHKTGGLLGNGDHRDTNVEDGRSFWEKLFD